MNNIFNHNLYKSNGHFKNKEARAQKLISMWSELEECFTQLIEDGKGITERSRCAYALLFMMHTGIRVGNESSAEGYVCNNKYLPEFGKIIKTFGLTSLCKKHFFEDGKQLLVSFVGKKGVKQFFRVLHPVLLKWHNNIKLEKLEPFFGIDYRMLRKFVHKYIGRRFQPKDIRTVVVNKLFREQLEQCKSQLNSIPTKRDANAILKSSIQITADTIGHTAGVCKSAYISRWYMSKVKEDLALCVEYSKWRKKCEKKI